MNQVVLCHGGDLFLNGGHQILCINAKWCLCHYMTKYHDIIEDEPFGERKYGGGYMLMGPGKVSQGFPSCDQFIPIYKPYRSMVATMKKWRKRR